jgi:hypothetical protein
VTNDPQDRSTTASITPAWQRFRLDDGLHIDLPGGISGDAADALESVAESPLLMWIVYRHNLEKYGPEWATQFRRKFVGEFPWEKSPRPSFLDFVEGSNPWTK